MNGVELSVQRGVSGPSRVGAHPVAPLVIENDLLRAVVVPGVGAGLASFVLKHPQRGELHLMRGASPDVSYFNDLACYVMIPWSNRVQAGAHRATAQLVVAGKEHLLHADWTDGTAIHGVCKGAVWNLLDRSPLSVRCGLPARAPASQGGWPWEFASTVRYELMGSKLCCESTVTNISQEPMPCGGGFHPFWNRRLAGSDRCCRVRLPVAGRY